MTAPAGWIDRQLRRRGIQDERVLAAMERVPREAFAPAGFAESAYEDAPIPLPHGQTISQPFMVALMCEALGLAGQERVLDVGTGSGYAAAVLAELAAEVHTIERIPGLAEEACRTLSAAGYDRIAVHVGDGALGLPGYAPFDAISVAAATDEVPQALWSQLREGGRIAVPLVTGRNAQHLCVLQRLRPGPRLVASVPARFVPLISGKP
jgi:protein-L-isoaspartate(D-aspartate) O-methyltransferase